MLHPTVRDDVGEISCRNIEDGGGDFNYDDEKSEEIASADPEVCDTYFYEKVIHK
jgi:hypothetical protein